MGSRDHYSRREAFMAHQPRHTRRRQYACWKPAPPRPPPARARYALPCVAQTRVYPGQSAPRGAAFSCPAAAKWLPSASPTPSSVASSSGYVPGTPRMPSVPKSCFAKGSAPEVALAVVTSDRAFLLLHFNTARDPLPRATSGASETINAAARTPRTPVAPCPDERLLPFSHRLRRAQNGRRGACAIVRKCRW